MKKQDITKLTKNSKQEIIKKIASGLKQGEGIAISDVASEIKTSTNTINRHAKILGALAMFYPGSIKTAYLVNPKFNK